ncbi:MAG: MOSC N-terminal beta barrel domain-containing protein, partial [Bacteroidetes bacterium]|nr:MOSC N-terminal beta barrel domain-containing protein [Bacteroidota bacterium]
MSSPLTIASLSIFPVKGLRGLSVLEARITPFGLEGDRRYMIVGPEGRFRSQRSHPAMTHIDVAADGPDWVL